MSLILMTTLFYKALMLQGEIWCWSLLGFKGLMSRYVFTGNKYNVILWQTFEQRIKSPLKKNVPTQPVE